MFLKIPIQSTYGVVCVQLRPVHQDPAGTVVQVRDLLWEPRSHFHACKTQGPLRAEGTALNGAVRKKTLRQS